MKALARWKNLYVVDDIYQCDVNWGPNECGILIWGVLNFNIRAI